MECELEMHSNWQEEDAATARLNGGSGYCLRFVV
jgi:hypothetical protein